MFPVQNIYSSLTFQELNTSFSPLLISCWSKGTLQPSHAICWHGKQGKWLCRCKKVSETGLWVLLLQTTEGLGFYFYTLAYLLPDTGGGLCLVGLHWPPASLLPLTKVFFHIPCLRQVTQTPNRAERVSGSGFGTGTVEDFSPAFCVWKQKHPAGTLCLPSP